MSYPRSIDEYGTEELQREIDRRLDKGREGLCDYCGRQTGSVPVCRFPDRHNFDLKEAEAEFFLSGSGVEADPVAHIPPLDSMAVLEAAHEAFDEVERQDKLAREGKFDGTHIMPGGSDLERLAVLAEEFGEVSIEVCKGITDEGPMRRPGLRDELKQTSAVCLAWIAAIDEGRPADGLPSPVDLSQTPEFAIEELARRHDDLR